MTGTLLLCIILRWLRGYSRGVRASSSGAPVHAGYRLAVRGGLVPDRHVEHCRWAEQRAMAHQDERWGGLAMQYGGYGGLFMG